MAVQNFKNVMIPDPMGGASGVPSYTTTTWVIDAASEAAGIVLQPPKAGDIRKIWFRVGTVTSGATIDIRVETVSATTGFPTGTLWATNTNGSVAIANNDDGTLFGVTLTADATVVKTDRIAIVIKNPSSSFGNMQIVGVADTSAVQNMPYGLLFTGGAWAQIAVSLIPICIIEYSDGSYAPQNGLIIAKLVNTTTYNSGTNPNHRALRFSLSVPVRVSGCWLWADLDGDTDLLLVADNWDGTDGNALAKVSLDKDIRGVATGNIGFYDFATAVSLSANTIYRLVIKPTSVTSLSVYDITAGTNAQWAAMPDGGIEFYLSTANNPTVAGSWTDTTTSRPMCGLILDGFDDGAGGSAGILVHPGMAGGV